MKRSKFSLSNYRLASMDMGYLVPIGWFEALPGDTIQHATSALVRASPMLSPVMHPVDVRIHHWFVPNRLLWSAWEDFITGGPTGTDTSVHPTITMPNVTQGSLPDYLGIPVMTNATVSALPFRAYNMIYNEWYRDQDLDSKLNVVTTSGNDTQTNTVLINIDWEKDYFTSARPFEQKGPSVTLPLGTSAPVKTSAAVQVSGAQVGMSMLRTTGAAPTNAQLLQLSAGVLGNSNSAGAGNTEAYYPSNLFADLSTATAATVNQIRQAMALQRIAEARARYGSRYVEYLRSAFGVRSSDARMQKPEYLGGGRQTIQHSEVLQTGPTAAPDQANVVGALKGHGIGAMRSNRYRRFIEEHGIIMSLMSIRPKTVYMQMMERKWNRRVREEYFQPELAHIGQQIIKNKEIKADHGTPEGTFGWQDCNDEYRRQESGVSGEFRTTTLNYWHMARDFSSDPALNSSFVKCVPTLRTFASAITDPYYVYANHSIQARRCVPASAKPFIF